jgi:amino acid adenylation domain-containing protein
VGTRPRQRCAPRALATRLAACGVGRGDRIAFCLNRGVGPLAAIAAASHLGAAFIPLDPEYPAAYRAIVVADCGAKVLVSDASMQGETASVPVRAWSREAPDVTILPRTLCSPSDVAYILFTSGSIGRPKGVMVSCGSLHAYADAMLRRLSMPGPQVFAIVTSFAADLGYTSVIGAVASGGTLNVVDAPTARDPAAFIAWMAQSPADVLKIVPSHLAALMTHPDAAALLPRRALICGGDVLTFVLVQRLAAQRPDLRVFNHYDPTETTIGCAMVEVTPSLAAAPAAMADGRMPVGHALDGAVLDIVDGDGTVLPAGETGEIRVSGAGVAFGYLALAADIASGFICQADGASAYLTGDLGTMDADGLLRFLGRKDDMLKIRGHRVDPNGVATVLRACPGVSDAAVLAQRDHDGAARLLGAVVAHDQPAESLAALLADRLPEAQRPSRLIIVETLPLTANGKVDRKALMNLFAASRSREPAAPIHAEGVLSTVLVLWRELFSSAGAQAHGVGPDDDFFALGGDSIMAIQLAGKARAAGWLLSPAQIFTSPTPRALAGIIQPVSFRAVEDRGSVAEAVPLTPIQSWFMAIDMPDRRHWALTAVFELPRGATAKAVGTALSAAVRRHDALRVRLCDCVPPLQQVEATAVLPTLLNEQVDAGEDVSSAEDRMADRLVAVLDPIGAHQCAAHCRDRRCAAPGRGRASPRVRYGLLDDPGGRSRRCAVRPAASCGDTCNSMVLVVPSSSGVGRGLRA